jgi:hypothetical protein
LAFHSGREADHSPPSSAEVKEWVELYLHSPNTLSWRGALLGGAQGLLHTDFKSQFPYRKSKESENGMGYGVMCTLKVQIHLRHAHLLVYVHILCVAMCAFISKC